MKSERTRLVSLRVSEGDYARLEQQAADLGLKPAVLARVLIRTSLNAPHETGRRHARRQVTAILDRIEKRVAAATTPSVDVVEVVRRARDDRGEHRAHVVTSPAGGE
jgi:hypothetical protein